MEYTDKIPLIEDILSIYMGVEINSVNIYNDDGGIYISLGIKLPHHCDDSRIIVSAQTKARIRCLCVKHKDTILPVYIAKQLYSTLTESKQQEGYIYCFATPSMPGIVKIGMTTRSPEERLKEANSSNTWKPPTPYHIVTSKKLINPQFAESIIHKALSANGERIVGNREFFKISEDKVHDLFSKISQ
jgi:hypothetical protein